MSDLLPLRQKTEFGTLREVVLGRTDDAAFPPKNKANANFTDHITDLLSFFELVVELRPKIRNMVGKVCIGLVFRWEGRVIGSPKDDFSQGSKFCFLSQW